MIIAGENALFESAQETPNGSEVAETAELKKRVKKFANAESRKRSGEVFKRRPSTG